MNVFNERHSFTPSAAADGMKNPFTRDDDRRYFYSGVHDDQYYAFEPGTEICGGRFEIRSLLARGAQATTYSSIHRVSGTPVALKVAHSPHCDAALARDFLLNEFRIYRLLGAHQNIVSVFDIFEIDSQPAPWLVMSMELQSESLRSWLNQRRYDQRCRIVEGKPLFRQILGAIRHLESHGVIARDIKPENIVISTDGAIKLIDFGLAISVRSNHGGSPVIEREWQTWCGTPQYMAPETFTACGSHEIDHRADIYSAGCIGYELFSQECRPPFQGSNEELRYQHLHCPAPVLQKPVPAEISRVVAKCLEKR